jgi:predicted O-methyltransferase YrrM
MADWSPESLRTLARSFMECRIFLTGAELGLFDELAGEARTALELAQRTGADLRGLIIVLDALAAMDLLAKDGGRYRADPKAAKLLSSKSPASVLPMVLHSADLWTRWSGLTERVGGVRERSEESRMRTFIGAMNNAASALAERIAGLVGAGPARRLLDVGGASGTYSIAFLRQSPELRATLFDRPEVIPLARERLAAEGLLDRVALAAGDFHRDALPSGHDLAFVSAIIHSNSPEQNADLFRNVHQSLVPGGRVVVRDIVLSEDRIAPRAGAVMAINWLLASPAGNSYTFGEIREGLEEAGFARVRLIHPDSQMDGLVEAFKP